MRHFLHAGSIGFALAALAAGALALAGPARADDASIGGFIPGVGFAHVRVVSLSGEKFQDVVQQHTDYSCGAASVATILRYAYGMDATENGVIRGMLQVSDPTVVRQRGFSLLDIKHYVQSLGMAGIGYKLSLPQLLDVKVPTIALMNVEGYDHFVVLRKATPRYVYVADPMLGNRAIPTNDFVRAWDGIVFVIAAHTYDTNTSLLAVQTPPSMQRLAQGMPPDSAILANAVMMTINIPASDRL